MPIYTLTVLDTVGIQDYIFGSNVLRENIGASELVHQATTRWPFEIVHELGRSNVRAQPVGDPADLDEALHLEAGNLDAEVLYAGGGNCAVLFSTETAAKEFVTRLSRRALAEAPELDVVAMHVPVSWDESLTDPRQSLAHKLKEALAGLAAKKLDRPLSTPLLGLATTATCRSTGLPAVGTDEDEPDLKVAAEPARILSAGILAKLRSCADGNRRLEALLPQFGEAGLHIPHDFDYFGRQEDEISYLAIVHADGNSMGKRIEALRSDLSRPAQNRAYIDAMRAFSRDVITASTQAVGEISTLLLRHWDPTEDAIVGRTLDHNRDWVSVGKVQLGSRKKRLYIPFRPLVFGGDDLTFVTDGRLGLALAAAYLESFAAAARRRNNRYLQDLQACAGVAVTKVHYPFARAYGLADDLCRSAKQAYDHGCAALDWHFAATGLFGTIDEIRARQYTVPAGHLEMRPVILEEQPGNWRSWAALARVVRDLTLNPIWAQRRNKVVALRSALRDGPDAVVRFRSAFELAELPALYPDIPALQSRGWDGAGRCGYFDAVEALEFFVPLDGGKEMA